MMQRTQALNKALTEAAQSVVNYAQNAVGDMGHNYSINMWDSDSWQAVKIAELKAQGVSEPYIGEALADYMYDDVDSLVDLCGDRIYDEAQMLDHNFYPEEFTLDELFIMICEEIRSSNSGAMAKAMAKLIERHSQ